MTIQLNQNVAEKLNEGMEETGGVELPFYAPYLWTINGNPQLKKLANAQYYGGWATKMDDMIEFISQYGHKDLPAGFDNVEISPKNGAAFDAMIARHVVVAPIATRKSWIVGADNGSTRYNGYQEGGRLHVQALVLLASKQDSEYTPFGPVVLSAKGFQGKNLENAFSDWKRHTAAHRKQIAPGVPAWCFYLAIGTFGNELKTKLVGRKNAQSPITPLSAYLPKGLTAETLEGLFVGETLAEEMAEYLEQSEEWLKAWKTIGVDPTTPDYTNPDDEYSTPMPNFEDEDIPF